MIYAFTETEKKQIESLGVMVVEFKRNLKMIESMSKVVSQAWEKFKKAIDDIRLAFEEIRENYDYPTSRRYKVVKILSKCTGLEKKEIWKMTRHTRLARSCL